MTPNRWPALDWVVKENLSNEKSVSGDLKRKRASHAKTMGNKWLRQRKRKVQRLFWIPSSFKNKQIEEQIAWNKRKCIEKQGKGDLSS